MTNNGSPWRRVSRSHPCPICGKPDWCLVAGPLHDPTAAICQRIESDKVCGQAGYLHHIRDDDNWRHQRHHIHVETPSPAAHVCTDLAKLAIDSARDADLGRLSDHLGVSVGSLKRLGAGWSKQHRAWTFPMSTPDGLITGIRLRAASGRKWSVRGGREALFIPGPLSAEPPLLITEGPTDAAAALDLGFAAIGRPSCNGGTKHIVELIRAKAITNVVIIADHDKPGQDGANRLANAMVAYVATVKIVQPPAGINDLRAWYRSGATKQTLEAAIVAAQERRLTITIATRHRRKCRKRTGA